MMNAYTYLSCFHKLGQRIIKEQIQELRTKHKQETTQASITPPFPVPQDPLEEIQLEHLTFEKHFELELTPPKETKEMEPTKIQ